MKQQSLWMALAALLILNIGCLLVMDLLTFEMIPGRAISGNGNPGILMWFIAIPCYLSLLGVIWICVRRGHIFKHGHAALPFVLLTLWGVIIYLQYRHATHIYNMLDGRIEEYGVINQYTNTVFLNGYTFLCGILGLLTVQSFLQRDVTSRHAGRDSSSSH